MKPLLITFLPFCMASSFAFADVDFENNSPSISEIAVPSVEDEFKKKIHKGDSEVETQINFGYSSFSGILLESSLSYRYFFFDKISLGFTGRYFKSNASKEYGVGLTGRWYFAEAGNWAFSLNQELSYNRNEFDFGGNLSGAANYWTGSTGLGAHYFFTDNLSVAILLNYTYGFNSNSSGSLQTGVGLNYSF